MAGKEQTPNPPRKRPYRAPKLTVHGNLRKLTADKGSNKGDGGKPATRNTGNPG
jgi:hypothetical protein